MNSIGLKGLVGVLAIIKRGDVVQDRSFFFVAMDTDMGRKDDENGGRI